MSLILSSLSGHLHNYFYSPTKHREIVIEAVRTACAKKGIDCPSESTIRRRMTKMPAKKLAAGMYGNVEAENQYGAAAGGYKEATVPLRVVQIDHTPLDLFLVDQETGDKIGTAWLSIAIDVFSRMVVGLYLSFEDPNTGSVAMCIYRSVVDKSAYLNQLNVEGEWPIWGLMRTIHADNGPDFRTEELTFACKEHQIDIQWRPSKNPIYGAHIEHLAKTINEEIKKLKGGIPADFKQRKHVKPQENGVFTIKEAEQYLVTWVTNVYHLRFHNGIGTSPLEKYKQGMLGGDRPVGVPCPVADPKQFYLDLTPCVTRTVQRDGIEIDNMRYFERRLEKYIMARDPENPKLARKFRCRTPIDDVRVIYFQDPDTKEYMKIRCADRTMPYLNRHELKLIRKHLNEKELSKIDMVAIKKGHQRLKQIQKDVLEKRAKSEAAASVRRKRAIGESLKQTGSPLSHDEEIPSSPQSPVPAYKIEDIPIFKIDV